MSDRDNEQTIRDAYAAFQRGDVEGVLDKLTDDVEWSLPGPSEIPYTGIRHGKSGAAEFFRILSESDEVQVMDPQTYVSSGNIVVVLGRYEARVKATGRIAQTDWVHVFTFRDGKVAAWREYFDTAGYAKAYRAAQPVA